MRAATGRVLLVDDDPNVLRVYTKVLETAGWKVQTAVDGRDAIERVSAESFSAVVTDISMPRMDGLEFLQAVRKHDADVPVVLVTGAPALDSAMRAVECGAFRYLVKPVDVNVLRDVVRRAARMHAIADVERDALELLGGDYRRLGERAQLEARFGMALRLLWIAFQPVVAWREKRLFGYEALVRSAESTMPNAADILDAAARLGRVHDLGRAIRSRLATAIASAPEDATFFLNVSGLELLDDDLYAADAPLSKLARKIVLELSEQAPVERATGIERRLARLRAMGFRIGVDHVGASAGGLASFDWLEPSYAKIDMSLVRGVEAHARKQKIVRSIASLCGDLGMTVVAEGVETAAERDALLGLGCNLLEGHLFGRAERGMNHAAMFAHG